MTQSFHTICIFNKSFEHDFLAADLLKRLSKVFSCRSYTFSPEFVYSFKIYYLSRNFSQDFVQDVAREVVVDSVVEKAFVNVDFSKISAFFQHDFDCLTQTRYKDGIVDNEASSLCEGIVDFADYSQKKLPPFSARSGRGFFLKFSNDGASELTFSEEDLHNLKRDLFEIIIGKGIAEQLELRTKQDLLKGNFFDLPRLNPELSPISSSFSPLKEYRFSSLDFEDFSYCEALRHFSEQRRLSLRKEDLQAIKDYFVSFKTNEKRKSGIGKNNSFLTAKSNDDVSHKVQPQLRREIELALSDTEQKKIDESSLPFFFPTIAELEVISQTWSEHCKHRIFAAKIDYVCDDVVKEKVTIHSLFRTFIRDLTEKLREKRNDLLSIFSDNAGIVAFGREHAIACKVETHNAPSAIDPFGGASTGIVGVNRDIIGAGLGFNPICNFDVLCFGSLKKKDEKVHQTSSLFHLRGVHRGIRDGGNESGVPTVGGAMVFHDSYASRPLVYCGTVGIAPKNILGRCISEKKIEEGDFIVMVGGRVGRDGIHGATVSSDLIGQDTPASVVQIADPITQKKVLDFILVARDRGLFRVITDNGAGGLSSSVGEMALLCGGAWLQLEKVPLKEEGLEPWEILISESQERMTLAVDPKCEQEIKQLAQQMDCEISFIGVFTKLDYFCATYQDELVCKLGLDFLHHGVPQLSLKARWNGVETKEVNYDRLAFCDEGVKSYGSFLKDLLARENIASKENLVRQFDHEVKSQTVLKPFDGPWADAPMDAAVMRPLPESHRGVVVSMGITSRYAEVDAYAMAAASVDEAVRGAIAVGAEMKTMVGLDDFCWPDPLPAPENPDSEKKLAQLVRACQALKDVCLHYELPVVSGKDSMKNDYLLAGEKKSIIPTLLFIAVSQIENCDKVVTSTFKKEGNLVYLLGATYHEMGSSEANALLAEKYSNKDFFDTRVPFVRVKQNKILYEKLTRAIGLGYIGAAHDISDGGLAVALAESAFGGGMGVDIDLSCVKVFSSSKDENLPQDDFSFVKLFSESQGRFVVEVKKESRTLFEEIMEGSCCYLLGSINDSDFLSIRDKKNHLLKESIFDLKSRWKSTFPNDLF